MQFQTTTVLFALIATTSALPFASFLHPRQLVDVSPTVNPTVSPDVSPSTSFLNGLCVGIALCNPVTVDKSTNSQNDNGAKTGTTCKL